MKSILKTAIQPTLLKMLGIKEKRKVVPVISNESSNSPWELFASAVGKFPPSARFAEFGTRQAVEGRATNSYNQFSHILRRNYVMCDIESGLDVDMITDMHFLPTDWSGRFDAVMASAVFEHLERPWIAAREVARVLAPEGVCYISTHQTFPLHGFPRDYFRFSKEALSLIFVDAGLEIVSVECNHRSQILAPDIIGDPVNWNAEWPSYLVVHLMARKCRIAS